MTDRKAAILKQQKAIHNRLTTNVACRKNIRSKSEELSALEGKQIVVTKKKSGGSKAIILV